MGNKENAYKLKYLPDTATSGKYLKGQPDGTAVFTEVTVAWEDISGKPTIEEVGATTWDSIPDKPATFPPSTHNHDELYEPKITTKRTAFNKDFGAGNGDVARGDHTHDYSELTGTPPSGGGGGYTKAEADAKFALKTNPPANFGFLYAPSDADLDESVANSYSNLHLAWAAAGVTAGVDGDGDYTVSGVGGYTISNTLNTNTLSAKKITWALEFSLPPLDITDTTNLQAGVLLGVIGKNGTLGFEDISKYSQTAFTYLRKSPIDNATWVIHYSPVEQTISDALGTQNGVVVYLQADTYYRLEIEYSNVVNQPTILKLYNAETGVEFYNNAQAQRDVSNKNLIIATRDGTYYSKVMKSVPIKIRRWVEITT